MPSRPPKTRQRKPSVHFCECMDHAWAPVTKGFVTLVSPEDADLLAANCWSTLVNTTGRVRHYYASRNTQTGGIKSTILLHRAITQPASSAVHIDHESNDGLDNRRPNLRPGSQTQNLANQKKPAIPTSSRFKGVCQRARKRSSGRWAAQLASQYIGSFETEEAAARAYDAAAYARWGSFALLNFPMEQALAAE